MKALDKIESLIDGWYEKKYLHWAMWILAALGLYVFFYVVMKGLYP